MSDQEFDNIENILKLENLISKHRDRFELRYSTETDVKPLHGLIDEGIVKSEISNWCFVTFIDHHDVTNYRVFLTGYAADGFPTMTSFVQKVDFERMAVITNSGSLYVLTGGAAAIPADLTVVAAVAATFNAWGVGPSLGMPAAFW